MKKLTKEQVAEIIKLKSEGISVQELAIKFNVAKQTILYWTDENYKKLSKDGSIRRFKELSTEKKKEIYDKKKEYMKNYMKIRYNSDPVFRQKHIELVKSKKMKGGQK
jgi:transposase-like protein